MSDQKALELDRSADENVNPNLNPSGPDQPVCFKKCMSLRNADRTTDSGLGDRADFDSAASTTLQRSSGSRRVLQLIFETFEAGNGETGQRGNNKLSTIKSLYKSVYLFPSACCITECNLYTRDFTQDKSLSRILHDITISCCVFPFAVGTRAGKPAVSRSICPLKSLGL